jgi:LacI family transcriptional regulator
MMDVARAAGVSQATVSYVINGRRDGVVAEETRKRVLEAATALNFRPNRAAQSLRLNQSFLVGIVARGIVIGPFGGAILTGIQKVVHAAGQLCMVVDAMDDWAEGDEAVDSFLAQGVSAIIYASGAPIPIHTSPRLSETRGLFVNCWPADRASAEAVILADEYGGGRAAAAAAFAAGHTDVAFLGGDVNEYACIERHRGFLDAARAAGIDRDRLFQTNGDYKIASGYEATERAFKQGHPTALVCGNDRMALGAILALHALGLEVPRDVSVIGYDDQAELADQIRPRLTTVALPHFEMGERAGQLLFGSPQQDDTETTLPCRLIERDSLGAPPKAASF